MLRVRWCGGGDTDGGIDEGLVQSTDGPPVCPIKILNFDPAFFGNFGPKDSQWLSFEAQHTSLWRRRFRLRIRQSSGNLAGESACPTTPPLSACARIQI
jgi:hypothetical protein